GLTAMPATTLPSRPRPAGPGPARPFAPRCRRGRVLVPSLLAGVLVALSVPPWGAWPLGPAGLGLLAWRLTGLPARTRVVAGLAAGFAWYMATLAWMAQFNLAGGFLAAVVEAGFVALACAATPVGPGPRVRTAGLLGLPAALVLAEGLVARWPFGGEPLGDVALGQSAGPLAQAARVGGPLLVIGLAATAGVAVVQLGRRRRRAGPAPGGDAGGGGDRARGRHPLPQRGGGVGTRRHPARPLREGAARALRRVRAPALPGAARGPPRAGAQGRPARTRSQRAPHPGRAPGRAHLLRGVLRRPGPGRPRARGPAQPGADQRRVLHHHPGPHPGGGRGPAAGHRGRPRRGAGRAHGLQRARRPPGPHPGQEH